MSANSIAPSRRVLDIKLDGSDWKAMLYTSNGSTQITSANVGSVAVDASSIVTLPLNLRAIGGDAANELRVFASAASTIKVRHSSPLSSAFPIAELAVSPGEVLGQEVEEIVSIGANITRVSIAWG